MKQFLLSVIFLLTACASAWTQTTAAANRADPAPAFGACTAGNSIIIANNCAGATLGLKVNAADAVLGSNPGEIWVYGGGAFGDENSRIIVSSNHTLRLFPGTYTSTGTFGVILLKDSSSLVCEDPANTIVQEPTHATAARTDLFGVVKAYGVSTCDSGPCVGAELGIPNQNISVKGCRFKGARSDHSGAAATVHLGNCHNCEISGNIFENLHSIAAVYGYAASLGSDPLGLGKYAEGSSIHHNTFIHCAAANCAVTNGQHITITDNTWLRPGVAGQSFPDAIDLEPNSARDRMLAITIANNTIDFTGAETIGDGIDIINGPGLSPTYYGQILITGNAFRGGLDSTATSSRQLRTALLVKPGVYDVTFTNNVIRFVRNSGIYVNGTRIHIEGNSIFGNGDPGGGYFPILFDTSSSESSAVNNRMYCNLNPTKACSTPIQNKGAASNSISGNLLIGPVKQ